MSSEFFDGQGLCCFDTAICVNKIVVTIWSQIKQICVIFINLKLWVAVARHNLKWVKIQIILLALLRVNVADGVPTLN